MCGTGTWHFNLQPTSGRPWLNALGVGGAADGAAGAEPPLEGWRQR